MSVREAYHAGSWYTASGPALIEQLDEWLANVPDELPGVGQTPLPGARVVISPHAGYAYSGPCAARAYRSLDLSKAYVASTQPPSYCRHVVDSPANSKRIFILHPSHHVSLSTLALPTATAYSTPSPNHPFRSTSPPSRSCQP